MLATAGALAIDMRSYQRFLLLLGAVFVPLLGVLAAHWLVTGAHYARRDIFEGPLVRPGSIVAWVGRLPLYEWLYQPTDLGFWSDVARQAAGTGVPDRRLAAELRARVRPDRRLSGAELAARDRHGRAADLDALNVVRRAFDPREQRRRAADLHALGDLDLVAERDPAVAGEMKRERPGRPTRSPDPLRRRSRGRTS